MRIDEQIDMVKLMRKSNQSEAKIWRKNGRLNTAWACDRYAEACEAVLSSLRRLKKLEDTEPKRYGKTCAEAVRSWYMLKKLKEG